MQRGLRIIKKGLVRKGLVIGIIVLFIGASVVPLGGEANAAFGKVLVGMDVLRNIASVETTTKHGIEDWSVEEVIINSVVIV